MRLFILYKEGSDVTKEQIDREFKYQTAKHLINLMLKSEIINESDYVRFNTKLLKKFNPLIGKLACLNQLKPA